VLASSNWKFKQDDRTIVRAEVKLSPYRHAEIKGERQYSSSFLTSALGGVSGMLRSDFTPGTHWIGGWVGLRAGLDTETRGSSLCRDRTPVVQSVVRLETELLQLLIAIAAPAKSSVGKNVSYYILGCCAVFFSRKCPTFQTYLLPPSSGQSPLRTHNSVNNFTQYVWFFVNFWFSHLQDVTVVVNYWWR
jgi:hypothetical protein